MAALRTGVFAFFALACPALTLIGAFGGFASPFPRLHGPLGNHIASYSQFYAPLLILVGWVLYLWDVTRNPRVPKGKRSLWSVVLLLGGPWALPFYFWHYVLVRTPRPAPGANAGSLPLAPQ
jgi:hypothetical protein